MRSFLLAFGRRVTVVTQKLFGEHLLLTNAVISTGMGLAGDGFQQYYEISRGYQDSYQTERASHMAAAGFTTGSSSTPLGLIELLTVETIFIFPLLFVDSSQVRNEILRAHSVTDIRFSSPERYCNSLLVRLAGPVVSGSLR